MKITRIICLYSLTLILACGSLLPSVAQASAGTLFFSPSGGRYDPGSSFTIGVKTNVAPPGTFAGGATVVVQFPKNILQATSTSTAGSAFSTGNAVIDNNAGTVTYTAFLFFPPSGSNLHLFNITFKAVGGGDATLSFGGGSNVHDGPTTPQNSTFLIAAATCPAGQIGTPPNCTTPPATCPAGQIGTPPNCTTPKPNPTPTPTPTPKPNPTPTPTPSLNPLVTPDPLEAAPVVTATGSLAINGVKSNPAWESGTITWATNQPDVTTVVQFGTSKDKLTTTINAQTQEDGTFRVTQAKLTPGTRYYYLINAISTSSGGQATYSGSFTTRGYPVKIIVKNSDSVAPGATVKLENNTYTTKQDGAIQTLELTAGNYKVIVTDQNGVAKELSFTVKKVDTPTNGKSPALQTISLDIANPGSSGSLQSSIMPIVIGILGGILLLGLIFGFLLWRRKRTESQASLPVATINDFAWAPEASTSPQSVEQQFVPEAEQPYAEFGVQNAADLTTSYPEAATLDQEYSPVATPDILSESSYQNNVVTNTSYIDELPDDTLLTPLPGQVPSAFPNQTVDPEGTGATQAFDETSFIPQPVQEASPYTDTTTPLDALQDQSFVTSDDSPEHIPSPDHDVTIEEVKPEEPSALYDESTGELSIIHHSAHSQGGTT